MLNVWVGCDIGGSHIGLSFFSSISHEISNEFNESKELEALQLPSGLESNKEVAEMYGDSLAIPTINFNNKYMLDVMLMSATITGDSLVNLLFYLISKVLDASANSTPIVKWNLKGVGIGCPGCFFLSNYVLIYFDSEPHWT